jgi:tetratricopeptide (TPR) repeat protein
VSTNRGISGTPIRGLAASVLVLVGCARSPSSRSGGAWMQEGLDALYGRHATREAADDFRKVLAQDREHYEANLQLAYTLESEGAREEARPVWEHVLALAQARNDLQTLAIARRFLSPHPPDTLPASMESGLDALYRERDAAKAERAFRTVLAANPTHYGATYQLAVALDLGGKSAEARAQWEKMLRMAQACGDAETIATAQRRLASTPAPAPSVDQQAALMEKGMDALYRSGDLAAAEERFRAVLALNPTHYGATYQLAATLERAGKRDEARPLWTRALAMAEGYRDEATIALIRPHLAR